MPETFNLTLNFSVEHYTKFNTVFDSFVVLGFNKIYLVDDNNFLYFGVNFNTFQSLTPIFNFGVKALTVSDTGKILNTEEKYILLTIISKLHQKKDEYIWQSI